MNFVTGNGCQKLKGIGTVGYLKLCARTNGSQPHVLILQSPLVVDPILRHNDENG